MEFLVSVLTVILVGILLATAFTFGFFLLVWVAAGAVVISIALVLREYCRRWRFLHNASRQPPNVIDADYKDITDT